MKKDSFFNPECSHVQLTDIRISPENKNSVISPLLFGANLEHTRESISRGLSAQMLRNRKFAAKPAKNGCCKEWFAIGEDIFLSTAKPYTCHVEPEKMIRRNECQSQRINNIAGEYPCGIGQNMICIRSGRRYLLEIVLRSPDEILVEVSLSSTEGKKYDSASFKVDSYEWNTFTAVLFPKEDDDYAEFHVTFSDQGVVDVGAVSLMPEDNFRGMRKDVVDLLKQTGVTVMRWPGGNFAGEYRWKDGLLPSNQRGPLQAYTEDETQSFSHGYDFHEINTDDFIALCQEIGAIPYLTLNPTWDTPDDCAEWVEYCNGGADTKYGKIRIERGYEEPYNVLLWGLGNEFGYGHMEGANSPADYSLIVRKCADSMMKVCPNLTFVSSGCFPEDNWFRYSAIPLSDIAPTFSYHLYTPFMNDGKGNVGFVKDLKTADPKKVSCLRSAYNQMLACVKKVEKEFETIQPIIQNKLKISYDEWNVWYAWYRAPGVAEGIYSALTLHMLMRRAEDLKIFNACYFEMVNEGGIAVLPDRAYLTPTGMIFSLFKAHINGRLSYADAEGSTVVSDHSSTRVYTLVNDSFDQEKTFILHESGAILKSVLYASDSINPGSTFEEKPLEYNETAEGRIVILPEHSVALFEVYL